MWAGGKEGIRRVLRGRQDQRIRLDSLNIKGNGGVETIKKFKHKKSENELVKK